MKFPGLLIVGAMKSGTTTLFRDLEAHPGVFFPADKEPGNLGDDAVLTDEGRARYAAMFARARADQIPAEASTAYTKRPDTEGCARRALEVCGPDTRILYIVRDPVKRLLSHHYHEFARGNMPRDIAEAVEKHPELTNYSRYAWQLEPWLEVFGDDRVRVVRFEDYVADRRAMACAVHRFLGLDERPDLVEPEKIHNKGDGKPINTPLWLAITHSWPYRRLLRPLLSSGVKQAFARAVLPKAPPRPPPPGDGLRSELEARFEGWEGHLDGRWLGVSDGGRPTDAHAGGESTAESDAGSADRGGATPSGHGTQP